MVEWTTETCHREIIIGKWTCSVGVLCLCGLDCYWLTSTTGLCCPNFLYFCYTTWILIGFISYCMCIMIYWYMALVGNVQAEKLSEDPPSILKGNKSASNTKKRKASCEERSLPVRLIWLAYVLLFQSNSIWLSDAVDGTLFSWIICKWKLNQVTEH